VGQALTLSANTSANFSAPGVYDLRLTASDTQLSASSDVTITVNPSSTSGTTSTPLVVNAGTNTSITLPASTNLAGTASGDCLPSCTPTVNWTMVSGPGTVTFTNPAALGTTATFSAAGTYDLRLNVTTITAAGSSDVIITVNPVGTLSVSAGANQTISLPSSVSLAGTATGGCLPSCTSTIKWTMASGPGTVTFANSASLTTTATFSTAGTYDLRLTVTAGTASASSDVIITVNAAATSLLVSAGTNQTITMPSVATLTGSATGGCLPSCSLTVTWTTVSGPGTVTFSNPNALNTTAGFPTAGTYTLQFTATAGVASTSSNIVITVNSCGVTVTGTVTVSANVTSSVGIASVQFQLDGANFGAALTAAPYSITWNTTTTAKACHVLTALATDSLGNQGTASVSASNP
jgi:hypothetical protein